MEIFSLKSGVDSIMQGFTYYQTFTKEFTFYKKQTKQKNGGNPDAYICKLYIHIQPF